MLLGAFFLIAKMAKQKWRILATKKTLLLALTTLIISPDTGCELLNNDQIHPFCKG
jgi:hypothetical protein